MRKSRRFTIRGGDEKTLLWRDDRLVDPASGWDEYTLKDKFRNGTHFYSYPFDRALDSVSRRYTVIYTALGTKALLLKGKKFKRELNRSFYHASAYEYPVAFLKLPDGSEAIIHCPESYDRLEIESVGSGERLTARTNESMDFFHSRLQVSPSGRYVISAGWVWLPWDMLRLFDIHEALSHPESLDSPGIFPGDEVAGEVESAAFLDDERIVVATGPRALLSESWAVGDNLGPREIGVWSIPQRQWLSQSLLQKRAGTLMPLDGHVVGFYKHPKLIDIASGRVILHWPDIKSGRQSSSVIHHIPRVPPIAMDPSHRRFAVSGKRRISIVDLGNNGL